MTSITQRNAQALIERNGTTLPKTRAVAKGNKAVAKGNQPTEQAVAPSNSPAPAPVKCRCGCGDEANLGRSYRPGHDARHASAVARAVIEDKPGAQEAMDLLPVALKAKAARMVSNHATRAAKKQAAAELRAQMQAELKAKLAAL